MVIEKNRKEVPTEEICGIAKKLALELEKLPIESHQVVTGMIAQLFQHRAITEQNRAERERMERAEERENRDRKVQEMLARRAEQLNPTSSLIEVPGAVGSGALMAQEVQA